MVLPIIVATYLKAELIVFNANTNCKLGVQHILVKTIGLIY